MNTLRPQEVLSKLKDKSITHNIFRTRDNDSIMCWFSCIAFIKYMIAGKTLPDFTTLFWPNDYQKNNKIIYKYFKKDTWNKILSFRRNVICKKCKKRNNLKSEKHKKCVNCFEHFIFISTVSGCVSISAFVSLVAVFVGITSSAVGLKIAHMWRKWDTPQNFCLAFIDELEKQLFIKKNVEVSIF